MRPWLKSIAAAALVASCTGGGEDEPTVRDEPITVADVGFATPESVQHDADADVYLVSNINGSPTDTDDNGFISRVSPDGSVLELKWIDGASGDVTLNAPKGMAMVGDVLYVTDITAVRMFNRQTGEPMGSIEIPGTTFLNDLAAAPDGSVYVTDSGLDPSFQPSGTDAVYRIVDGEVETLATGDLGRPNGVLFRGGNVWLVSYGSNELFRIADGGKTDVRQLPAGGLDGLIFARGRFLVTSWEAQSIFTGLAEGPFEAAFSELPAPADLGFDARRGRLLVPLFQNNEVRIIPLETP